MQVVGIISAILIFIHESFKLVHNKARGGAAAPPNPPKPKFEKQLL
jgi:hypothetical protein